MSRSKRSKVLSTAAGSKAGQEEVLLPGLPDHLAHLCLASLPPPLLFAVCRSWRRLLYSPSFPPPLSLYAVLTGPGPDPGPIGVSCYDPISDRWASLPDPPLPRLLLSHPSFIARRLTIQSASAAGRFVLVAATAGGMSPAIPTPLVFDPPTARWRHGPALPAARRWCAVGSSGGSLYVASGVGSEYSSELARSADRWDLNRAGSGWERLSPLRDGRFSREAVEMVSSNGKLCMVNSKGRGAKEGIIYDIESDRWAEMPVGLLTGWTGPATVVEDGGPIFVVDEASGALRRYEWVWDTWTAVVESEGLKGAVGIAGGGGRVCVACGGGAVVKVVDVAGAAGERKERTWTVALPEGRMAVALHVLPRMIRDESRPSVE